MAESEPTANGTAPVRRAGTSLLPSSVGLYPSAASPKLHRPLAVQLQEDFSLIIHEKLPSIKKFKDQRRFLLSVTLKFEHSCCLLQNVSIRRYGTLSLSIFLVRILFFSLLKC